MLRDRTSILLALLLSVPLIGCGSVVREVRKNSLGIVAPPPSDMGRAQIAWSYFAPAVPAEDARGAGFVTPASLGDDIAATYAARQLGLIDRGAFNLRIDRLLAFLMAVPLSDGMLPGRYYAATTGVLINPQGVAADPGWSGVETGRLLIRLRLLSTGEPRHSAQVAAIVGRWQLCRAIDGEGSLLQALPAIGGGLLVSPDIGTGYAGLATLGLQAWGIAARRPEVATGDFAIAVEGVALGLPSGPQIEPLLTAPLALMAMVFGWSSPDGTVLSEERQQAAAIADVQQRRDASGVPTARSSFRRGTAPYQVENAVLARGYPWSTMGDGVARPDLALVSVAAAFGLRALTAPNGYGDRLVGRIGGLQARGGWREGQYEDGTGIEPQQTAATNAMVLDTILYRQVGTLYRGAVVAQVACAAGARP